MWILEPSAKENGIQSTTRYRRKDETRRGARHSAVNDYRVRSGRRGGWAAQKLAKLRRYPLTVSQSHSPQHIEDESSSSSLSPNFVSRGWQDSPPHISLPADCHRDLQPPQLIKDESSSCSGSPVFGSWGNRDFAPPYSVSAGYYQPYLPSPPLQSSFFGAECYNFTDPYTCMPLQPTLQSPPNAHNNATSTMLPALTSSVAARVMGNCSTSHL